MRFVHEVKVGRRRPEFETAAERAAAIRARNRHACERHRLRQAGLLPPPSTAGIAAWWRARELRA